MEEKKDLEQLIHEGEDAPKTMEEILAEADKAAEEMNGIVEAVKKKIDRALGLDGDGAEASETPETPAEAPEAEAPETAEAPEVGTSDAPETPAPEPEKQEEEVIPSMDDYKDLLEASYRQIHVGDVMKGTVVSADETGVLLDLNYYAPGRIPAEEMSNDPHFSIVEDVQIGDVLEATVTKRDDGSGTILLSRKQADDLLSWDRLVKLRDEKTVITAKIGEVVKAGAILYVEGVRGFIPASRLALEYVEDTSAYLGKTVSVQVLEVDKASSRLILSAKELLQEKAIEEKNARIAKLTAGNIVEGTVESIKDYGAFVDIGDGISGLLHISQISSQRVKNVRAVLKEGQKVRVLITKVQDGRVSLSMKALEESLNTEKADEEVEKYNDGKAASTSLADLLKNLKF